MARSRSRADNNDTIDLAVLGGLKDEEALKALVRAAVAVNKSKAKS